MLSRSLYAPTYFNPARTDRAPAGIFMLRSQDFASATTLTGISINKNAEAGKPITRKSPSNEMSWLIIRAADNEKIPIVPKQIQSTIESDLSNRNRKTNFKPSSCFATCNLLA